MLDHQHIPVFGRRLGAARAGGALALSLAALIAPATASAAWTTPVDLSDDGQDAYAPSVAVGDGDAVLAWRRFDGSNDRIEAVQPAAADTLGTVRTLSRAGQPTSQVQVDVDDDGDAVFVWLRSDGITTACKRARSRRPATRAAYTRCPTRARRDLAARRAERGRRRGPRVAALGRHARIEAVALSGAGTLGRVKQLSDASEDAIESPGRQDVTGRHGRHAGNALGRGRGCLAAARRGR
jgi:hypothetical protein